METMQIVLDGKVNTDLDWRHQCVAARQGIEQGMRIFWELDLGFSQPSSKFSFSDQSQYLSLLIAIEHFRDHLWKEFKGHSVGLCLYRGDVDFSRDFPWGDVEENNLAEWVQERFVDVAVFAEEIGVSLSNFSEINSHRLAANDRGSHLLSLFCRDVISEYLELLTKCLAEEIPVFLRLDNQGLYGSLRVAQLLTQECFTHFHLIIDGLEAHHVVTNIANIAVCLPSMTVCRPSHYLGLNDAFECLEKRDIAFRIIPESMLTTEWDGLDYLIVDPLTITPSGRRKLQGFCAAGGSIVIVGNDEKELGLSRDFLLDLSEFLLKIKK